jgi:hypothetical protein
MLAWIKKKLFMVQWGRAARRWSIERFMPTIDLNLSEQEQNELENMHAWRQLVAWYMLRFKTDLENKQIYCYGVAHGSTVHGIVTGLRNRDMNTPHMQLFDSFEGLPEEEAGIAKPAVWSLGAFSAPRTKLEKMLQSLKLSESDYSIHEGWFKDTLKAELVENGTFKPAAYVDIDADLYNSTMDIFDFMFKHKLIGPGTLIGYDDWGDTDLWTAGESRAHNEIVEKYGVQCAQLFSWGEPPLIRKLFLVVGVDEP